MRPIAKIQGLFVIYYFCKCRFVRSQEEKSVVNISSVIPSLSESSFFIFREARLKYLSACITQFKIVLLTSALKGQQQLEWGKTSWIRMRWDPLSHIQQHKPWKGVSNSHNPSIFEPLVQPSFYQKRVLRKQSLNWSPCFPSYFSLNCQYSRKALLQIE